MLRNRPQRLLSGAVTHPEETRHTPAFGLERIHWQRLEIPATGVGYVVLATPEAAFIPGIHDVKSQRAIHTNGWMHALGRLPGPIAHACNELPRHAGGLQRQWHLIAGDLVTIRRSATDLHLQTLHGRIHIASRATNRAVLSRHMPGLQGRTQ